MSTPDVARPFVIHLGIDGAALARLEEDARSRGMSVVRLSLAGIPDRASLVEYLASAFMFPHEVGGLDAAVDLISDLEWFGNSNGYLVVACDLAGSSTIGEAFVSMLPNIVDRWRSQAIPFIVAIDAKDELLQSALRAANMEMQRAGELPWAQPGTGPVDISVHEGGERRAGE